MPEEIKLFSEPEELIEWLDENDILMWLEVEDAQILLGYMEGHDYAIGVDTDNKMVRVDVAENHGEIYRYPIDEVISIVCEWNYELILNETENMNHSKSAKDYSESMEKLDSLLKDEARLDEMFSRTTYAKSIKGMSKEQVQALVNNIKRHTDNENKSMIAERNGYYKSDGKEMKKNGR